MDEIFFQIMLQNFHQLSAPVLTHKWAAFQWTPDHVTFMATGVPVLLQPKEEPGEEDESLESEEAKKRAQSIQRDTDQIGSFEL